MKLTARITKTTMTDPYYNKYQRADWLKFQAMKNVIGDLHKQRNTFVSCGLDEPARRIWGQITDMNKQLEKLADKMKRDRERMSAALIEVILIANLAYAKAMEFGEIVGKITGKDEDALAKDVKRIRTVCEEVALSVDVAGTDRQAKAFSDVIDKLEETYGDKLSGLVSDIMEEFSKSDRFKLF